MYANTAAKNQNSQPSVNGVVGQPIVISSSTAHARKRNQNKRIVNLSLVNRAEKNQNHDDDQNRDEPTAHIRSLGSLVVFRPFFLHAVLFVCNIV